VKFFTNLAYRQLGRERFPKITINLENCSESVADILESIFDRVSLGYQFRDGRRGDGITSLGLRLKDEWKFVMHGSIPLVTGLSALPSTSAS
jgi:hypothetical protein